MHALQALGERVVALTPEQTATLALPERLLDAIALARTIRAHEGLRRQMQYIGRLMRDVDAASIEAALDGMQHSHRAEVARHHAAERWRDRLGDCAWVRTRDEAIDEGWFGPVADDVLPRYGDVVAAPTGEWAFMTRTFPQEMELVGMHASLTAAEMVVPLVVATGR